MPSQHLRSERNDLHVVLSPELARDGSEDTGADRLALRIDQHGGIAVEPDQRAVGATHALGSAHDDGLHHLALLHATLRNGFLDRDDDDVANGRVLALRAAQHLDALNAARARIVSDVEIGLHLDHRGGPFQLPPAGALHLQRAETQVHPRRRQPAAVKTTQRLFFEIGALSTISTRSPILNEFFSSWAWYFFVRRTVFLNSGCV